jgi:hypothetical protein
MRSRSVHSSSLQPTKHTSTFPQIRLSVSIAFSPQANYTDRAAAIFGEVNANFCGVITTDPHEHEPRLSRPHEAEWTPFQTHRYW